MGFFSGKKTGIMTDAIHHKHKLGVKHLINYGSFISSGRKALSLHPLHSSGQAETAIPPLQ